MFVRRLAALYMQGLRGMHVLDLMQKKNKKESSENKHEIFILTRVALGNAGRSNFGTKWKLIRIVATLDYFSKNRLGIKYTYNCNFPDESKFCSPIFLVEDIYCFMQ